MHQFCNRSTCDLLQMSSSSSTTNSSLSMVFPTPPQNDPSSSVVDCTLSLGTPSTRQSGNDMMFKKSETNSSFLCWAPFHTKKTTSATAGRGCASNSTVAIVNGDPLLARRCANCGTTSTPLWRNGPRGPKSLCNACGIRYKKEERRATATGTTAPTTILEPQQHHHHAWTHQGSHSQFRFLESDQANGAPFFTWHVTDRTSLVHD